MLDPAPRVLLDKRFGMATAGRTVKDALIVRDLYQHTMDVIARGEMLGGFEALPSQDIFDVEYWDLEQAKLESARPASRRSLLAAPPWSDWISTPPSSTSCLAMIFSVWSAM
jgi:hypothetical protein